MLAHVHHFNNKRGDRTLNFTTSVFNCGIFYSSYRYMNLCFYALPSLQQLIKTIWFFFHYANRFIVRYIGRQVFWSLVTTTAMLFIPFLICSTNIITLIVGAFLSSCKACTNHLCSSYILSSIPIGTTSTGWCKIIFIGHLIYLF